MNDYWELKPENWVENAFMIDKSRTINLFVSKIDQGSEISSLDIINENVLSYNSVVGTKLIWEWTADYTTIHSVHYYKGNVDHLSIIWGGGGAPRVGHFVAQVSLELCETP